MNTATWIFRLSFRQLVQRKRAIGLILLTALPGIVLAIASASVSEGDLVELYHELNVGLFLAVGLAVTALLNAASAFGEERRSSTLSYIVVKPVPRWIIAVSVTAAASAATLALAGIGMALTWIVAIITIGDVAIGVPAVVALVAESLGYSAIFVPLGLVFSRATLAGLAYIFVWEFIMARALTALAPASIWITALSGYADLTDDLDAEMLGFLGNLVTGVGGALAKMLVAVALSFGLTTLILKKRDLA
jgi:ABC-2 type transport system permease protein